MQANPYRVIQWATGNIGTRSLRAVIEHPNLELAGLYVHSADKAGRDAGELCGLGATGVSATRDIDEILSLGADCVLYMPRVCDIDEMCRLLASGANIVTTRGEFHHPASMSPPSVSGPSTPGVKAASRSTAPAAVPASSPRPSRSW